MQLQLIRLIQREMHSRVSNVHLSNRSLNPQRVGVKKKKEAGERVQKLKSKKMQRSITVVIITDRIINFLPFNT